MPLVLAILASGRGSNAKAILDAIERKELDAIVACLICNVEDAPVLALAKSYGVETFCIPHEGLKREQHEQKIIETLAPFNVDYVVLAGYMRLIKSSFLNTFKGDNHYRIINIHPALLPAFAGAHGYEDAYNHGVKVSGVTVHFVDEGVDTGPILLQQSFERDDEDSLESFKAKGLAIEHQLYPKALQLLAEKRVTFNADSETGRIRTEVKNYALR